MDSEQRKNKDNDNRMANKKTTKTS